MKVLTECKIIENRKHIEVTNKLFGNKLKKHKIYFFLINSKRAILNYIYIFFVVV